MHQNRDTPPKVFLSSTCYDLIDLRAVVASKLAEIGFAVLGSDLLESDFAIRGAEDSVEICLDNVRASDALILVIDRRYGPTIPGRGELSATHLEYDAAMQSGVPVITFARAAFLADLQTYHRTVKTQSSEAIASVLQHVSTRRTGSEYEFERLFRFFDSIRRVDTSNRYNWYDPFQDAVELSTLAARRLSELVATEGFHAQRMLNVAATYDGTIPITLPAPVTQQAIRLAPRLRLTSRHLQLLAKSGVAHEMGIGSVLALMDEEARTDFLKRELPQIIEVDRYAVHLREYFSEELAAAVAAYVQRDKSDHNLSAVLGQIGDALVDMDDAFLERVVTALGRPASPGDLYRKSENHDDQVVGLRVLEAHADLRFMPEIVACLGDRGAPRLGGDPVVRAFLLSAFGLAANEHHPAVGEGPLLVDGIRCVVPSLLLKTGDDEFPAGVSLSGQRGSNSLVRSLVKNIRADRFNNTYLYSTI